MNWWNKMRWILALLLAGLTTQAAVVYAVLFFRQIAQGAPTFWNAGYAVLWSLWAIRLWLAASTIRRQDSADVPVNTFKGSVLFMTMAPMSTSFSYFLPRRLPDGSPGAAAIFLVFACLTLSLSLACAWYEHWQGARRSRTQAKGRQ